MSISHTPSAASMIGASSSCQPCCCVNGCHRYVRSALARSTVRKLPTAWDGTRTRANVPWRAVWGRRAMAFRKYQLGTYEEMLAQHRWEVPERYNIATDVCDKHDRD